MRRFSVQGFQVGDLVAHSARGNTLGLGLVTHTGVVEAMGWKYGGSKVYWFKSGKTTLHHPISLKELEESHK